MKLKEFTVDHLRRPFIFVNDVTGQDDMVMVHVYIPLRITTHEEGIYLECVNMYSYDHIAFIPSDNVAQNSEIRFLYLVSK